MNLLAALKTFLILNLLREGDEGRNTSVNPQIQLQYVQAGTWTLLLPLALGLLGIVFTVARRLLYFGFVMENTAWLTQRGSQSAAQRLQSQGRVVLALPASQQAAGAPGAGGGHSQDSTGMFPTVGLRGRNKSWGQTRGGHWELQHLSFLKCDGCFFAKQLPVVGNGDWILFCFACLSSTASVSMREFLASALLVPSPISLGKVRSSCVVCRSLLGFNHNALWYWKIVGSKNKIKDSPPCLSYFFLHISPDSSINFKTALCFFLAPHL